jgi:hypothetical protein
MTVLRALGILVACMLVHDEARGDGKSECLVHHVHGQELRARGELRAARQDFRACTQAACPSEVRVDCTQWLSEVSAAIPTLVIDVRDADGHDVTDASVLADDQPVSGYLNGHEIELDPGQHKLRVQRPNGTRAEQDVVMHVGDRARRVAFTLPRPAPERVLAPPPAAPERVLAPPPTAPERGTSPVVWVLGAVAAAGAASFAAFGVAGYVQHRHLQNECGPSCDGGRVDAVRTVYALSDVSLGMSLVTAGLALYFYLTQNPTHGAAARF